MSTTHGARFAASGHLPLVSPLLRLRSVLCIQDLSIHPLLKRTTQAKARRCRCPQKVFYSPLCSEGSGRGHVNRSRNTMRVFVDCLTLPQRVVGSDGGRWGDTHTTQELELIVPINIQLALAKSNEPNDHHHRYLPWI